MAHVVTEEDLKMLDEMVARGHEAQKYMMTLDQQQIDRLVQAVAASVCDATVWAKLADEAVDETRLGDKVTKRNKKTKLRLILRDCLRNPSVGVIEDNPAKGHHQVRKARWRCGFSGSHHQPLPDSCRPGFLCTEGS